MNSRILRTALAAILVLAAPATAIAILAAPAAAPRRLALVGGMLITGLEEPPLHHAAVLIEGDRIKEVQRSLVDFPRLAYFSTTDREMFFGPASLKQWIDAGAVMGMGTDSGTPMNFHTEALWREIKAHVDMGMPPRRAIVAATRINARVLGMEKDLGTIEPGKLADLIVVRGNPLFDIVALSNVDVVVKDGVVQKTPARRAVAPR